MQGCGMKRTHFISMVIASLALSLLGPSAIAAVKAGGACKKSGDTVVDSGYKYKCIKSGKKLIWNKGVKVVTSTVKPTPTPASTSNKAPVVWRFDGKEWISQGSVPQCPSPLILTGELLDFSKVL
jgi:enterochelin esterase-like enzyme